MRPFTSYILGFVLSVFVLMITTITNPHPIDITHSAGTTAYGWPSPWLVVVRSYSLSPAEEGLAPGAPVLSFGGIRRSQFAISALTAFAFGVAASLPPIVATRLRRTDSHKNASEASMSAELTVTGRLLNEPPPNHVILLLG